MSSQRRFVRLLPAPQFLASRWDFWSRPLRPWSLIAFFVTVFAALPGCGEPDPKGGVYGGLQPLSLKTAELSDAERARAEETLALFGEFQSQLQTELGQAIAAGGPPAAIDRCKMVSPKLEKELSNQNVTLRRVSDRPRNPDHVPSELEARALEAWRARMDAGEAIGPVLYQKPEGMLLLKPIAIQKTLCLNCHGGRGEEISAETMAAIQAAYPEDQATGYSMGDLRGAFSAQYHDR